MDIPRSSPGRRSRLPLALAVALGLGFVALVGTRSLRSAVPTLARAGVVVATVQRGSFEREVRAAGRLVPEETRWVTAITPGRVDSIAAQPGARVKPDTLILTLQNPDVLLASLEAERDVTMAQAASLELETRLGSQAIDEEARVASIEGELANAERRAGAYADNLGLVVPRLDQSQMEDSRQSLSRGLDLARQRLSLVRGTGRGAILAWREQLVRAQRVADFRRAQVAALEVRAGAEGTLVDISIEPGQWAPPGAPLASVVKPERLEAELRVPEALAKDISLGVAAEIDTHNGVIAGRVKRVAAAARDGGVLVEVALPGALPPGARPQLNIDGVIRIETIPDAVFVERPAAAFEAGPCRLYRLSPDGRYAERVLVTLGRTSALAMEVRSGLVEGDRIIISDTSRLDSDRIALD